MASHLKPEQGKYTIEPHEETIWGTMFAILDPDGKIVGLDRYVVAKQRCAHLNSLMHVHRL